MKTIIIEEKRKSKWASLIEWLITMMGYALILISISILFPKTLYIDNEYFGLWALLAVIVINILNHTIKPVLVWLTLPLTALSLGIFYPFINVFILKIVDVLFASHVEVHGILMTCFVAILISFMNMLMDHLVIKPMLRKE